MNFTAYLKKNLSFLIFLVSVFAVRWSFADQYQVPTGSMEPNIHVGDRIFVNKAAFTLKVPFTEWIVARTGEPARGDIVVFKSPEEHGLTLVKRVVGLPGDHITVKNGFVFVNDVPFKGSEGEEEKLSAAQSEEMFYSEDIGQHNVLIKRLPNRARAETLHFEVPADQYFMMGDNRDNSHDSRYWGFAPRANLKGRAVRVLWNFSLNDYTPAMELDRFGKLLP